MARTRAGPSRTSRRTRSPGVASGRWMAAGAGRYRRSFAPAGSQNEGRIEAMIDHVSIGVRDLGRAKRFYDAAFRPLGYSVLSESPDQLGYGREQAAFWVGGAERPVPPDLESGLHFCF